MIVPSADEVFKLIKAAGVRSDSRILCIGEGARPYFPLLAALLGKNVTVDIVEKEQGMKDAKKKFHSLLNKLQDAGFDSAEIGSRVHFVDSSRAEELQARPQAYNIITLFNVLDVPSLDFENVSRSVLAKVGKGTRLFISALTPNKIFERRIIELDLMISEKYGLELGEGVQENVYEHFAEVARIYTLAPKAGVIKPVKDQTLQSSIDAKFREESKRVMKVLTEFWKKYGSDKIKEYLTFKDDQDSFVNGDDSHLRGLSKMIPSEISGDYVMTDIPMGLGVRKILPKEGKKIILGSKRQGPCLSCIVKGLDKDNREVLIQMHVKPISENLLIKLIKEQSIGLRDVQVVISPLIWSAQAADMDAQKIQEQLKKDMIVKTVSVFYRKSMLSALSSQEGVAFLLGSLTLFDASFAAIKWEDLKTETVDLETVMHEQAKSPAKEISMEKKLLTMSANEINNDPKLMREIFREFQKNGLNGKVSEQDLAKLLVWGEMQEAEKVNPAHKDEQTQYERMSFVTMMKLLKELNLSKTDVFYDLGAGYGDVVFYTALVTDVGKAVGIELVPERAATAEKKRMKMGLENVKILSGNASDETLTLEDGNIFFMFNPFNEKTLQKVIQKLEDVAKEKAREGKSIKIIFGGDFLKSDYYLHNQPWLKQIKEVDNFEIFESQVSSKIKNPSENNEPVSPRIDTLTDFSKVVADLSLREDLEYGMQRGTLPTANKAIYDALIKAMASYQGKPEDGKQLANTLARMKQGSIELLYQCRVLSEKERNIFVDKNVEALDALLKDEKQKQDFLSRLYRLVESYDKEFSVLYRDKMFKRLVPFEIITYLVEQYNFSLSFILEAIRGHPDFIIWIPKAAIKVQSIQGKVGGSANAWHIVIKHGLEKTDAWIASAEPQVKALMETSGWKEPTAWTSVIGHSLDNGFAITNSDVVSPPVAGVLETPVVSPNAGDLTGKNTLLSSNIIVQALDLNEMNKLKKLSEQDYMKIILKVMGLNNSFFKKSLWISKENIEHFLGEPGAKILLAREGEDIVGFARYSLKGDRASQNSWFHLDRIVAAKGKRVTDEEGKGEGRY
ncbi:MAG: hypothetical protein NT079_00865 [Candidatus Omnitrophica bacterium]|nr:hypothetical protein [Candidatus Omnitrophota bacterium]